MASTIITKNSSTVSAVPLAGSLVQGELAVNVTDRKIYTKDSSGNVVLVASSSSLADGVTLTGTQTMTNKTLVAPTIASANLTTALTIAGASGTSGQVLTSSGAGAAPVWSSTSSGFTLGTPIATTSGTSIDFTGIPAGTKQIIINFRRVSVNTGSNYLIQIGDSGGIEDSGYVSRAALFESTTGTAQFSDSTSGFINRVGTTTQAALASGSITLTLENATSFTWVATGILFDTSSNECSFNSGSKSLSAVLDRVRITTTGGTGTFDNGEINIAYI